MPVLRNEAGEPLETWHGDDANDGSEPLPTCDVCHETIHEGLYVIAKDGEPLVIAHLLEKQEANDLADKL